jgi:hypothetical protein
MKPHFLFSASPLDQKMIDPEFQDQAIALKQAGFNTSVISFENETIYARPNFAEDEVVVYRGWMMSDREYDILAEQTDLMGGKLLTSKEQYYATHYIPNWYPRLMTLTAETFIFTDMVNLADDVSVYLEEQKDMGFRKFLLKDFVKSLKTGGGSVVTDPKQIPAVLENMEKYRGSIEGGVCVRFWEDFVPSGEKRFFVIDGKFYGQEFSFDTRAMSVLIRVAREIESPFFSVDLAQRTDGLFRVVEIGDGQVSDLVGWTPERFAEIWK